MIKRILARKDNIETKLQEYLSPFVLLLIRLYMGWVFFKSGWAKFSNYLNDNWDLTIYLFQEEHPVPILPADVAAVVGTAAELIFPALLVLGICGRCGALGLLFMTAVIEFTYMSYPQHQMWALLLLAILAFGSGKISIEHIIRQRFGMKK
jgi:putative oxidoreductase